MHDLIPISMVFLVSFLTTFLLAPWIIPKLRRAGITGRDMNKPGRPEVPEMGGFTVIFGLSAGVLLAIALSTFFGVFSGGLHLGLILAAFATIMLMALVGIFDDLFAMHQIVKAALPLFAALPLVAVKAGGTTMDIPFIGSVPFGVFYTLILIPVGVAGASNVTNMLAGFNGLEAGMGAVACLSLGVIALGAGKTEAAILLLSMCGALLAFLYYNWCPAKVLIGDIGTLSIGAVIASSVIIGDFEMAGVIVIIPYAVDFFMKAVNRFPSKDWWGEQGWSKLVCRGKPVGFCQWIMKAAGGVTEQKLVLILIMMESLFGVIAITLFLL